MGQYNHHISVEGFWEGLQKYLHYIHWNVTDSLGSKTYAREPWETDDLWVSQILDVLFGLSLHFKSIM